LVAVDAFGERLFTSTVVRRYSDSAGEVYSFRFTQRYFNNGPGLWQRLPPDEARLFATEVWTGQRISVTYPVADAAWMAGALPQIDNYLTTACADWACPARLTLPVVFSGLLNDMPRPVAAHRAAETPGGYPIIFDTAFRALRYPRLIQLASPQLAGVPHDEAASQALVRAITVDLLGQLAAEAAGMNRGQHLHFLDALVARAEARLGLSATPPPQPTLTEYVPVTDLWQPATGFTGGIGPPSVTPRLQAVWFLDDALRERLPSVEAELLATVRQSPDLADWLARGAQLDGQAAIARWEASMLGQLASAPPTDWSTLAGLSYVCSGDAWLIGADGPQPLPRAEGLVWDGPLSVSPDGTHIAAFATVSDTRQLQLVDMSGITTTVIVAHDAYPAGWAANGDLVYVDQTPSTIEGWSINRLRVYGRRWGATTPVTGMEVVNQRPVWSADHRALAVTLMDSASLANARTVPAVITFDENFSLLLAAWEGHSPSLSPDGRWLAYITRQAAGVLTEAPEAARVDILDLETGTVDTVLTLADLPVDQLVDLSWSPDGARLALVARQGSTDHLFDVTLIEAMPNRVASIREIAVPTASFHLAGFSSDSQYLAVASTSAPTTRLVVLDLGAAAAPAFEANVSVAVWSPAGHQLAVANAAGLFIAQPATGETQWIQDGDCAPAWHSVP